MYAKPYLLGKSCFYPIVLLLMDEQRYLTWLTGRAEHVVIPSKEASEQTQSGSLVPSEKNLIPSLCKPLPPAP